MTFDLGWLLVLVALGAWWLWRKRQAVLMLRAVGAFTPPPHATGAVRSVRSVTVTPKGDLYTTLQAELQDAAYAGMSDTEAAAALNSATVQRVRRVPIAELASLAFGLGLTVRLRVVIRTPTAPIELVAVCESLLDLLKAPFDAVDIFAADGTLDPATAGMLGALTAAGLLAQEERAMIEALGVEFISRAAELGLGEVTALDVSRARGGAW